MHMVQCCHVSLTLFIPPDSKPVVVTNISTAMLNLKTKMKKGKIVHLEPSGEHAMELTVFLFKTESTSKSTQRKKL